MTPEAFRKYAHEMVDRMADYLEQIEQYPVKSQVKPGEILAQLPETAPQAGEALPDILADFDRILMPGITHWQHPQFYAYFPANSSYPSILAEMMMAALGVQGMIWETSPAAAELEERTLQWLAQAMALPQGWTGAIQSTASEGTLIALLSARERATGCRINERGFDGTEGFRVYASSQTHSSLEKGVKIAGLGRQNLVSVETDAAHALRPEALRRAIELDRKVGKQPLCVVATLGTTSSTAIDPLGAMADICNEYGIWLHVDAAYAGPVLLLPEYRWMSEGLEQADSLVFNPHKWMLTNFDCSVYWVKDREALLRTFEIMPEYLRTRQGREVNNYRDWGIPLGRRFRALKLWMVLRSYGIAGLQAYLRGHLDWAHALAREIADSSDFELLAPVPLSLVCFRYAPAGTSEPELDRLNEALLNRLNDSGRLYLTHTRLNGRYTLRLAIGTTKTTQQHVAQAWELIQQLAREGA